MKIDFSGEGFGNLLFISGCTGVFLIVVILYIAQKKGFDAAKPRFFLTVVFGISFVFVIIPLWFSVLTIKQKFIVSILALAGGAINYIAFDRLERRIKKMREEFKDDKKEKLK